MSHRATLTGPATAVAPGTSFTVTGAGFPATTAVTVGFGVSHGQSGDEINSQTVTSKADGTLSATIAVPGTAPSSDASNAYSFNASVTSAAPATASDLFVRGPVTILKPNPDTDGDGIVDTADCNVTDKTKPAQGAGVVDANCNGVNDALEPKFLVGTKGNDKLVGGVNADTLKGGAGNDVLLGGAGNDVLDGGVGNDKVDGGTGNDKIVGGAGNDKLLGGSGNDVISGGPGNDAINGGAGKDKVSGGAGNDKIVANDKTVDVVACGPGKDAVVADKGDKVAKDCEKVTRH
ncbi:MAG: calcium-binding protein [Thermoleophilia bacterium]|nr:calcium-binding protein [Thermoleophilia bacterium]